MNPIDWLAENFCVYPPCDHFWYLVSTGSIAVIIIVIWFYFTRNKSNEIGEK